jgi:ATP-binding cassette, subfamily B, bacterial PglK
MKIKNFYILNILNILSQQHKYKLSLFILLFILGTLLETIGIGFIIPVIESISNYDNFRLKVENLNFYSLDGIKKEKVILVIVGLLLLIYTIKNIFLTTLSYLQFNFLKDIKFELGNKAFKSYIKKKFINHLNTNSSEIIRNINDSTFATEAVKNLMIIISEIFVIFGISIFLFIYQPLATLISLLLMIFFLLIFQIFSYKKSKIYGEGRFLSEEKKLKFIKDIFGSVKDIKINNKENYFSKKFNKVNKDLAIFEMKQNFLSSLPRFWLEWTTILIMVVLIFYFVFQKFEIEKYFVILGVFAAAAFRLMPSFSRIISALQRMKFVSPVLKEYKKIITDVTNSNLLEKKHNEKNFHFQRNIVFKNIVFFYEEGNQKIFDNLNFQINKGEFIGIGGKSGSGKSTLINILTGLLDFKSGQILVDNQINISDPKYLKNWQKKIGYVPQNIFIHDNSIIENVAFGIDHDLIDISRIISLLEDMQLYEFAESIKKDPKKSLGEYGDKISGGQKQRLGIARALYNNPEILILDESTSALDLANEEKIIKDILNLKSRNITVVIISHRQSSLKYCDKIYSIENQKIFENEKN